MYKNISHANDVDDVRQSLVSMIAQESSLPPVNDYMTHLSRLATATEAPADQGCRYKMADWCFQVVDFCRFSRSTAAVAMGYLDRYLATGVGPEVLGNRKLFQLASMTCLYTAIKIHEPEAMEPKTVAELSHGVFNEHQVVEMERNILSQLRWRLFVPTAHDFVHHMLALVDDMLSQAAAHEILERAVFQTEQGVGCYDLCRAKASSLAFASLSNAMNGRYPLALEKIARAVSIDHREVRLVQPKLRGLMQMTAAQAAPARHPEPNSQKTHQTNKPSSLANVQSSPRGVVAADSK